jgi:hypothetical protein
VLLWKWLNGWCSRAALCGSKSKQQSATNAHQNLKPVGSILIGDGHDPDLFSFTPVANAVASARLVSNSVTVTGINVPASISIVGGTLCHQRQRWAVCHVKRSRNQQPDRAGSRHCHLSAAVGQFSATPHTIGGYRQASSSPPPSTRSLNATPIPYSFNPQINVPPSTFNYFQPAATIKVPPIMASPVSIIGGDFRDRRRIL